MAHIFFSYSRKDKARVDQIIKFLQQNGLEVWLDRTGIRGGEEWRGEIVSAIKEADVIVLLLSPNSIVSENVRKEVDVSEALNKNILPIQFEETEIPDRLLYQLSGIQIQDMSGDLEGKVQELSETINALVTGVKPAKGLPAQKPVKAALWRRKLPIAVILGAVAGAILLVVAFVFASNSPQAAAPTATTGPAFAFNQTPSLIPVVVKLTETLSPTLTPPPVPSPTVIPSTPTLAKDQPTPCTAVGQTWVRPKDKMIMQCVPAGKFTLGYPDCKVFWCQNEAAQGSLDVAAYWIDRNAVTNTQFQTFVSETNYVTAAESSGLAEVNGKSGSVPGANWRAPQGVGSSIFGKDNHPVVQMNWFSANEYCKWAGGRLPSEVQWEKAARGTDGRLFPWGNFLPASNLLNAAGDADGYVTTSPVGFFRNGNSPYGLVDMAGNVYEWTRSLMKSYPYDPNDGRENDANPSATDRFVVRGGSFYTDYGTVRSTYRVEIIAQSANDGTGFRCVIDQ